MISSVEVRARMLEAFRHEQHAHQESLRRLAEKLDGPPDPDALSEAKRSLHSLKGTSRLLQLAAVEQLAHAGETLLLEHPWESLAEPLALLREGLEDGIAAALHGLSGTTALDRLSQLRRQLGEEDAEPPPDLTADTQTRQSAQISVATLENLIDRSGQIRDRSHLIAEIAHRIAGLEDELPVSSRRSLARLRRQLEGVSRDLGEATQILREDVRQLVVVPARDVLAALPARVRELAREQGKEVQVECTGLETHVELPLLQALVEPLTHLLRNAVDHGIEEEGERVAAGKKPQGCIRIALSQEQRQLRVLVEDDGRGLQLDRLRAKLPGGSDLDVLELLSTDGLSSKSSASLISGRGLGMGTVLERVREWGGSIRVEGNEGTRFELRFPHQKWETNVLIFRSGGQSFAIRSERIGHLRRIKPDEVARVAGTVVPVARRLGLRPAPETRRPALLNWILIKGERRPLGFLEVDEWLWHRSVRVQTLSLPEAPAGLLEGAFWLEDGQVCLVLSPDFLLTGSDAPRPAESAGTAEGGSPPSRSPLDTGTHTLTAEGTRPSEPPRPTRVLVVDDSPTVRTLQMALLGSEGYEVRQAQDGLEALELLEQERVEVVVTDVQMPRMDGLELLRSIRTHPGWEDVRVVVLTSLESEEERRHGLELGADAYLVKQTFDHASLIETIERLT